MSLITALQAGQQRASAASTWRRLLAVAPAVLILILVVFAAFFPGLFAEEANLRPNPGAVALPPSAEHWLGTDLSGRDIYTRIVFGTGLTLSVGIRVVLVAGLIGLVVGLLAGLGPRWLDAAITRVTEVLLAFPELLIALAVVAILGRGPESVVIGVTTALLPAYLRQGRVYSVLARSTGFVEAAKVLGVPRRRIAVRHIMPSVARPLLVLMILGFGSAVTTAAGLTFLGLGMESGVDEWGVMMQEGRNRLGDAWWITSMAGFALLITVVAVSWLGRWVARTVQRGER